MACIVFSAYAFIHIHVHCTCTRTCTCLAIHVHAVQFFEGNNQEPYLHVYMYVLRSIGITPMRNTHWNPIDSSPCREFASHLAMSLLAHV